MKMARWRLRRLGHVRKIHNSCAHMQRVQWTRTAQLQISSIHLILRNNICKSSQCPEFQSWLKPQQIQFCTNQQQFGCFDYLQSNSSALARRVFMILHCLVDVYDTALQSLSAPRGLDADFGAELQLQLSLP